MLDQFDRKIYYLRVSVTDRCNLRCVYCMPSGGVHYIPKEDILSLGEIRDVVATGANLGITKVRLTGGEPLVRQGIVHLVELIRKIDLIQEITMTTNGTLLSDFAIDLKKAGLDRINISLDTISPLKYKKITRGGDLQRVFEGIRAAKSAGFDTIKINSVKTDDLAEEDEMALKGFCEKENLTLRFIHQMDLRKGTFTTVEGGDGGNCALCNRLRLMANGTIKPCLFTNAGFNIREHGIEQAYKLALGAKPQKGAINKNHNFYNIGG